MRLFSDDTLSLLAAIKDTRNSSTIGFELIDTMTYYDFLMNINALKKHLINVNYDNAKGNVANYASDDVLWQSMGTVQQKRQI